MNYTVLGSSGFIGSNLVKFLEKKGHSCFCPDRNHIFKKDQNLGHVIYCIGLTSDFRKKPFETIEAHICKLKDVLTNSIFDSFLYLSSTRIYNNLTSGKEDNTLIVDPNELNDLYNISKIMGESLCLSIPNKEIKVIRLSNVIGNDFSSNNFLFSLIKEAVDNKQIILRQSLSLKRDYINLDEALSLIEKIIDGKKRLYNVASGASISNEQIIDTIFKETGCTYKNIPSNENSIFPVIDISNIKNEFNYTPQSVLKNIKTLIRIYQNKK